MGAFAPEIINALIVEGADLNGCPNCTYPPLLAAARHHPTVIELLVKMGADLTWRSPTGRTLREIAEAEGWPGAPILARLEGELRPIITHG